VQVPGVRFQVIGGRAAAILNCELRIASCLLNSGQRRLPSAFDVPQVRKAGPALRLLSAYRLLPTAYRI